MNVASKYPPRFLRCDVPGCTDEIAVRVGDEQRCFCHAMERAREMRHTPTTTGSAAE